MKRYIPDTGHTLIVRGGHFASVGTQWSYHKHHHHTFELLHCMRGRATEWVNGRAVRLAAGDWLLLNAGVLHSTLTQPDEPFDYFTVHFDTDDAELRHVLGRSDCTHIGAKESRLGDLLAELERHLAGLEEAGPTEAAGGVSGLKPGGEPAPTEAGGGSSHREPGGGPAHAEVLRKLAVQSAMLAMIRELLRVLEVLPPVPQAKPVTASDRELAHAIERLLDESVYTDANVTDLAKTLFVNRNRFNRAFHSVYGISPHRYLSLLKLAKAKELILHTNESLESIGSRLGFSCASSFSRQFRRWAGYAPNRLR